MAIATFADFFVLRTPLLPAICEADDLSREIASALDQLGDGPNAGVIRSTARLPVISEALYVASPQLWSALVNVSDATTPKDLSKLARSLVRYVSRAHSRPTPFGIFAGCSTGRVASRTNLALKGRPEYRRHVALDWGVVHSLFAQRDVELSDEDLLCTNDTVHSGRPIAKYVAAREIDGAVQYHLETIEVTPYIDEVLRLCEIPHSVRVVKETLAARDRSLSKDDIDAFIVELVRAQVLVSDWRPCVTGPDPFADLRAQTLDRQSIGIGPEFRGLVARSPSH